MAVISTASPLSTRSSSAGNTNTSHHLLTCFEFASKAELDEFYGKIWNSFGTTGGIKESFTVARNYENQIVAPAPDPGKQTEATDSTRGSSPVHLQLLNPF